MYLCVINKYTHINFDISLGKKNMYRSVFQGFYMWRNFKSKIIPSDLIGQKETMTSISALDF